MSFGIGTFPFAFFTSTFNFGDTRPSAGKLIYNTGLRFKSAIREMWTNVCFFSVAVRGTPQYEEEQFLSKVFLWVALVFICWLLMA